MRILMVTNKVKTYALSAQNTFDALSKLGHKVVWAADFSQFIGSRDIIPAITEQISINTNPFKFCNISAYKQLLSIIEKYDIEAVMCSTPIGGMLARLAALQKNIKPVLYAAHGFLFFEGAPLINNTIYKLEELILAYFTDTLITITDEDYRAAKRFNLRENGSLYLVHGAGVKVGVSTNIDRLEKRKTVGVPLDAFVIVSAGELNRNKNTEVIVRALQYSPEVHYVACGVGPEKDNLIKLASKLGVTERFHLLGYRTDMPEILSMSDAFTMMSFREGMPRALLEAMDLGLPCIGSNTRGIRDLIDSEGGFICNSSKPIEFANAFNTLKNNKVLCVKMGKHNRTKVKDYSADVVKKELYDIYKKTFSIK